ncbi:phosphotransferase [Aliikangiella coralliicola]|nr:aminoglycoside 3'-phosphotransferase/choline kinase family protein [Aliikangiella coralliicola]
MEINTNHSILETILPTQPTYQQSCDLIDNAPDEHWSPALEHIRNAHQLRSGDFVRIKEGANALFKLNQSLIIKLVPPNWVGQGDAEIESSKMVTGKLSLATPEVIAHGKINNWIYVVMSILKGETLADVWDQLDFQNKRLITGQLGQFIRELHQLPVDHSSLMNVDWPNYIAQLNTDCVPRHTRNKVPQSLIEQIPTYLSDSNYHFDDGKTFFIHMDLHPWNLMVEKNNNNYRLCGVLDFGDAIIGRSRLLELATPILFLCQGDKMLIDTLLKNYQLLDQANSKKLQQELMTVSLLRPACDFNFVLQQVPTIGPRETWQQIAAQLFPA